MAARELATPNYDLPEPEAVGIATHDIEWLTELWTYWRALDKQYLPSQIANELKLGFGGVFGGLIELESLYQSAKGQLENRNKKK